MKTTLSTLLFVGMILIPNLALADILPIPYDNDCDFSCLDCKNRVILIREVPQCRGCTSASLEKFCPPSDPGPRLDANGEYILPEPELKDDMPSGTDSKNNAQSAPSEDADTAQSQTVPPPTANHHRNCSTVLFSNTSPNIILLLLIALCAILSFFKLRKSNS